MLGFALAGSSLAVLAGCACGERVAKAESGSPCTDCDKDKSPVAAAPLPENAGPGECFAQVYVPPVTETVSERVCVKAASERLEIVPARYEWVEERVVVKPASKRLEIIDAEHRTEERFVQVQPGYSGWEVRSSDECAPVDGTRTLDGSRVFCFVSHPAVTKAMTIMCPVKEATVREIPIPAEYETVRVQKLVEEEIARRVPVAAEYEDIMKTVVVTPGRVEWQRTVCEEILDDDDFVGAVKGALNTRGYDAGEINGDRDVAFWNALRQYQLDNALSVGALTPETVSHLGVNY